MRSPALHRPTTLRAGVAAITALCLVSTACAARFPRQTASSGTGAVAVDDGSGQVTDTGEPVGVPGETPAPGQSLAPGETPAPGTSTGPTSGATSGPQQTSGPTSGGNVDKGRTTGVTATEIKIGYLLPITGAAPVPPQVQQGVEAYWKYVNSKGGIFGRKVTVTIYDTQSDESVAKSQAQKLIDDGNFLAAALDRLGVQGQIGRYLDERHVPNIEVQTPVNLAQNQTWTFGITIDHEVQGRVIAHYMKKVLNATKVAVVYERDSTLTPGVNAFKSEAAKVGMQVVFDRSIDGQGNDFSGEASGLSTSGATVAWLYMAPTPAAKLANQANAIGYHPVWFANSISWNFDLIFNVAPTAMKGARAFSPWIALSDGRTATYQAAYRQFYNDPPLDLGIPGWGIGQIIAAAIQNAGKDLGQNNFRDSFQHLHLTTTGTFDKTPLLWAPIAFNPGVREGSFKIATFKENGTGWAMDADYRSDY